LWQASDKSAAQVERELGITKGLLVKWRDRYQVKHTQGTAQLVPSDLAAAQMEVRRLRRALAVAEQERDILKKAVSIFSQLER
jgi:transposase